MLITREADTQKERRPTQDQQNQQQNKTNNKTNNKTKATTCKGNDGLPHPPCHTLFHVVGQLVKERECLDRFKTLPKDLRIFQDVLHGVGHETEDAGIDQSATGKGNIRSDQIRSDAIRYQVQSDQIRSDKIRSDQIRSGQIRSDRIRQDKVR